MSRNPYSEEIKRLYWQLFTLNIGILILLVQQIDALQKKHGFEYLGFCGRDTHYMRLLYEKYKRDRGEEPVPNDYLYYSRKLIHDSGEEMAKYFSAKIGNRKALLIDLCGTGTHLHNFREEFNLSVSILMCIIGSQKPKKSMYPTMRQVENWTPASAPKSDIPASKANFFLLETAGKIPGSDSIELLNRATHNSPVKLQTVQVDEKILPEVFLHELSDTENFDVMEDCFREVLKSKSVLPANDSIWERGTELLLSLLGVINSSQITLPLKGSHNVIGRADNIFLGLVF